MGDPNAEWLEHAGRSFGDVAIMLAPEMRLAASSIPGARVFREIGVTTSSHK